MQIFIQIILVIAVIATSLVLMRGGANAKHMAVRRILLVIFAFTAALSVVFPGITTAVAHFLGIGRGADLVLYGLIVAFLVYTATTYQRFRQAETNLTRLARRIALDEAEKPWDAKSSN